MRFEAALDVREDGVNPLRAVDRVAIARAVDNLELDRKAVILDGVCYLLDADRAAKDRAVRTSK